VPYVSLSSTVEINPLVGTGYRLNTRDEPTVGTLEKLYILRKPGVVERLKHSTLQSCLGVELTSVALVVVEIITDEIVRPTVVDKETLITLDGITVGLLDSVIVPEEIWTGNAGWLLAITTGAEFELSAWPLAFTLFGEIETTRPASAVEGAVLAAFTAATVPALPMPTMPDVRDTRVPRVPDVRLTVPELSETTVPRVPEVTLTVPELRLVTDGRTVAEEIYDRAVTTPVIDEVMVEDGPTRLAITGADVLPFEIGEPTLINWLIVATVPVPLDGTPEVTPTEVRSDIS
jgi:hypothetical protein